MGVKFRTAKYLGSVISGPRANLAGKRFGKLMVNMIAERRNEKVYWLCTCDCGTKLVVLARELKEGKVTACVVCR